MSSSVTDSASASASDYLTDHPRMLGVVFMTLLLLSQAGSVSAAWVTANAGP